MGSSGVRRALILGLALAACTAPVSDTSREAVTVVVDGERLEVWLADEPAERRVGLIGIEELPRGVDGMLFTWSEPTSASFHMESTPMALDIWWFDAVGRLVGSSAMEPCFESECVTYRSPGQVKWALETPLGDYEFTKGSSISTVEND